MSKDTRQWLTIIGAALVLFGLFGIVGEACGEERECRLISSNGDGTYTCYENGREWTVDPRD